MIYLIKSGSYSDVEINGYFTNEEDAYEYCELVRQKYLNGPDYPWRTEYYVEPVQEMQVDFPKERLAMLFAYSVFFQQIAEGDKLTWNSIGVIGAPNVLADTSPKPVEWHVYRKSDLLDQVSIKVALNHPDRDKALKIAQDYFAQLRAEGKIDD